MKVTDEEFNNRAKRDFDASVEKLDAATLSRLNQARHAALAELQQPTRQWSRWVPAAGVAAAALVAVMIAQNPVGVYEPPSAAVADMEILLGEDSIEMLEELEFYSWLDVAELEDDVS
jgi:hypothetical protein